MNPASHTWTTTTIAMALALGALTSACGDGGDANSATARANGGPLYLIATNFEAGEQKETYLVTTRTFDRSTVINPTDGPKLLGGVTPVVRNASAYVPDSNAPVMARYTIGADDKLVKSAELSFMGVGMTEISPFHVYAVSDTKGYVFDPTGARIVVWNPATMELTGKQIPLPEITRPGWKPNLVLEHLGPVRRGNQLLIPLGWSDQDGNSRFASGVLIIDTESDTVVAADEDERCGESYDTIAGPGGEVYFFPPDWSSAPHFFAEKRGPTCVLRVAPGATSFDETYRLDLSALGSGSAAAGAIPDGVGGFFFTTIDEALWDGGKNQGGPVWRTFHHDLASGQSRPVPNLPVWSGHCYYVNVGGDIFLPYWRPTPTGYRTTLYTVKGAGDPTELFSFDANWYGAGRLR